MRSGASLLIVLFPCVCSSPRPISCAEQESCEESTVSLLQVGEQVLHRAPPTDAMRVAASKLGVIPRSGALPDLMPAVQLPKNAAMSAASPVAQPIHLLDASTLAELDRPISSVTYTAVGGIIFAAVCLAVYMLFFTEPKKDATQILDVDPESRTLRVKKDCIEVHSTSTGRPIYQAATPNAVHTNRFTIITWLPKSLYSQFHRIANIYFLLIALLALTPLWGGNPLPKGGMVGAILLVQALKDAYEDRKRARDDQQTNGTPCRRYDPDTCCFAEARWEDVAVGDFVLVDKKDHPLVPADLLVLASATEGGTFYLSTKSLDGETNLKERQSLPQVLDAGGMSSSATPKPEDAAQVLLKLGLEISLEPPEASLVEMKSSLLVDATRCGASLHNFALRGTELRNTSWILGVACYVGDSTKVRMNSSAPPSKRSELEAFLNNCVITILVAIFAISVLFAIFSKIDPGPDTPSNALHVFVRYFVMFYCVLPMTLYIAYEFLHLLFAYQIETDPLMYDESTDTNAKARNTSIIEELGQVEFVFSDKTGTLTANEMRFAACCIGTTTLDSFLPVDSPGEPGLGLATAQSMVRQQVQEQADAPQSWGAMTSLWESSPASKNEANLFFESLAVCHTLKLDEVGGFEAESPDEAALAQAARDVGFSFDERQMSAAGLVHGVRSPSGEMTRFSVEVLAFTSDRKRMSVIYPSSNGGGVVVTKGADNVMKGLFTEALPQEAQTALDTFSRKGLRTLVVARREMSASAYSKWKKQWSEAHEAREGREEAIAAAGAVAETDMSYVGITALEDRLQDHVPETIANLRAAGIHVWVLTGDKVETAVEIAKSCKLFEEGMELISIVNEDDSSRAQAEMESHTSESKDGKRGMVLDGVSVKHILEDSGARRALYGMAEICSSCVCCRLSPLQKRALVELVREQNPKAITLSIGDGANDVPMIQGAHVGIGIRGKEGSASVQASDMAISQFHFLGNLLFCHGRKAYRRIATFLCFFIYRSVVLGWSYVCYGITSRFSGALAYPELLDMTYNPLTTVAAVVLVGFDSDYKDELAVKSPQLYMPGLTRMHLNARVFARWMFFATLHGIMAWEIPVSTLTTPEARASQSHSFWEASFVAFSIILLTVHLKLILVAVKPINAIGLGVIVLEMLAYIPIVAVLTAPLGIAPMLKGVALQVLTSWRHMCCLLCVPLTGIALDMLEGVIEVRVCSDG